MKLKDGFLTYATSDNHVLVAVESKEFSGMVRSNETAAFIIECLKQETTSEAIIDAMQDVFDAPREKLVSAVDYVLDQLRAIGALNE